MAGAALHLALSGINLEGRVRGESRGSRLLLVFDTPGRRCAGHYTQTEPHSPLPRLKPSKSGDRRGLCLKVGSAWTRCHRCAWRAGYDYGIAAGTVGDG